MRDHLGQPATSTPTNRLKAVRRVLNSIMAFCLTGCGAAPATEPEPDEADATTNFDSDVVMDIVNVSCGPDDTTPGGLSWRTDIAPGCNHYLGSIHIPDETGPNTLAQLNGLLKINGSLTIFRPHVPLDLDQLVQLEMVDGEFSYRLDDAQQRTLIGPPRLRDVGELRIESNPALKKLADFAPQLRAVHGDLIIRYNPELPSKEIEAFLTRINVYGDVLIEGNGHVQR